MASESYKEQLLNPLWKARRLEILRRDNYQCKQCGNTADESLLHIHHRYYLNSKKAWEYDDIVLITLCDGCHKIEEWKLDNWSKAIIEILKQFGGMSDQLVEFSNYLILIGNTETCIQVLHDYWEANRIKPDLKPVRSSLFGEFIQ